MAPEGISKKHYYVFLASPGDMAQEREYVHEYFRLFNISNALRKRVHFEVIDYKTWSSTGVGRPQQLILEQALEEHQENLILVVGLMGSRFGTPSGKADSGTEEEFRWALDGWRKEGWPEIKWFFRTARNFSGLDSKGLREASRQLKRVEAFKKELDQGEPRVYYKDFDDSPDFAGTFDHDLNLWLNDSKRPWAQPETNSRPPISKNTRLDPLLAHPYPLPPNFTGRVAERKMLTEWFTTGTRPVCVIDAIGGMGKSALSRYWLNSDVLGTPPPGYTGLDPEDMRVPEAQRPEGVLFWSFYESDAQFGAFLRRAAEYVSEGQELPKSISDRELLEILLNALYRRRILLILDGFERELRAYAGYRAPYQGDEAARDGGNDCCDPRAAFFLQGAASLRLAGKVLITSRLMPNELHRLAGCRHERLDKLSREDVVTFFGQSGVKGTRPRLRSPWRPTAGIPCRSACWRARS